MLEVRGVSKRFGETMVLHPLSLSFPKGKTLALLGPSGCGKSTLLRIIMGLVEPDTGQVLLGDEPRTRRNVLEFRRRLGYMIQDGGLFPHLTAADNVTLMARRLRWEDSRIQARLAELAAMTGLDRETLEQYPGSLSGGQTQRVALMRALFRDPEVILLDEPMGALDPLIRFELQNALRDIFQQLEKTVVVVTHDISEAGFLADEVIVLKDGHVLQRGSLRALVDSPADPFVTEFIQAQRSPLESL
ncbi:MAG: ATP-binding cassette domain-containing protein [Planctomycetales bacterium]|nr:ATP-binding cassette domain-containing protein [Planctomycetales bacterium]